MTDIRRFLAVTTCLLAFAGVGSPAAAQTGTVSAPKGAISVVTLTETAAKTTTSNAYVDLASTVITIPAGQAGRVLVALTGEAKCTGSRGSTRVVCFVRILVDGVETHPRMEDDALEFVTWGDLYWESQSIDRVSQQLPAGTHTVTVQWRVQGNGDEQFWFDDWQLKLAVWRTS